MCLALKLDSIRNEIVGNSINRYYFDDTDYSGPLRATCPEFESHHSGE